MSTTTTVEPRWLDAAGHAWPLTGEWCALCGLPLVVIEPWQVAHPSCEDHGVHDVETVRTRTWRTAAPSALNPAARGSTARCRRSFHDKGDDVEDHEDLDDVGDPTLSDVEGLG